MIKRLVLVSLLVLVVACVEEEPTATPILAQTETLHDSLGGHVTYDDLLEVYVEILERIENHAREPHHTHWGSDQLDPGYHWHGEYAEAHHTHRGYEIDPDPLYFPN